MHSKGYAHRDLKVENILCQSGLYKLIDFGSASGDTLDYTNSSKL
jgi:serine/threonine protein kinase